MGIANPPDRCYLWVMPTLTVKLPAELSEQLTRRARVLSRPKSEIVRQALAAQLNGEIKFASLLDRAGDLVGMYASGRKDASHKRHLKNLGRKSLGRWKRS